MFFDEIGSVLFRRDPQNSHGWNYQLFDNGNILWRWNIEGAMFQSSVLKNGAVNQRTSLRPGTTRLQPNQTRYRFVGKPMR